ncbi:MAG: hypothetical protein KF795_09080 [Labilithrix sp.]|nr:hypothetical protein [Labilithrix sp.]
MALLVGVACTGGSSFATSNGSGGASGAVGSGPTPPPGMSSSSPEDPPMPFVACFAAEAGDAGLDDGGDLVDADSPPVSADSGVDDSPCETPPPPDCVSSTEMVIWLPGECDGEQCVFAATRRACPGGCFRQVDGGDRCNE